MTPDERLQEIRLELAARNPENKIDPTLDRIRAAAEILGDPQLVYPVIHIAGTNGKTTTSRMIETLLREFGLTTGLMTSPHLHDERERIRLNGEPVDVQRFIEAYEEIEPYLGLVDDRIGRLSYFEVLTLLGFAIFADAPVGVAVIEVGLGGELDASNIVEPVVTVAAAQPADSPAARPPANGHETVLLVEDEDSVRRLARMALERHGYQVLTAANGRAALAIAEDRTSAPIDLIITDVVMPEMSGRQLVDILRTRRPEMKVLFMSGYIQDSLERHDVVREPFLHKPFTLSDFATAVRRVLDGLPSLGEPPAGPGSAGRGESRDPRRDGQAQ